MHRCLLFVSLLAGCSQAVAAPTSFVVVGSAQEGNLRIEHRQSGALHLWLATTTDPTAIKVLPSKKAQPIERFAGARRGVTINGGFYEHDRAMGLVVAKGKTISPLSARGGSGIFTLSRGRPDIVHKDAYAEGPEYALQSIDRLVDRGRSLVGRKASTSLDARSAVFLRPGEVGFVVLYDEAAATDERGVIQLDSKSSTTGISLFDFAALLARSQKQGGLGATKALNLDGGYSTSLVVHVGELNLEIRAHRATINAISMR